MTELLSGIDAPSDAELISAVRGGDVAAYGELFSRHVEAARRLGRQLVRGTDVDDLVSEAFAKTLQVLQNGGGPDVAFRAYLLTSVRRLHVDRIRAAKRVQPSDDMSEFDDGIPFQDTAVANFENGAAAKAFSSLPERWQLVLWHLEVEGQKPADIAPLLGMSPNSVSALAYRAREGLRQAFLTMHLADSATEQCRWTNEHLGAFVRSGLSKRDTTKVQSHLDECRRCTAMYLELNEVNSNLAGIIAPLLLGAAAAGYVSSAGAGATGISALFGRVRDALTGNGGSGGAASTTTSAGGVTTGGAATGGAAAATGAAGAAAGGAAVAAGSAATLGGILTVGGAIAAGVAVVTTAAFVVGGGSDKETFTEADRPAVVQTPTGDPTPGDLDPTASDPAATEDPSVAPSDGATVDYVVPGTSTFDPTATADTQPESYPQDAAPPPAPAPADPAAPPAPGPNDPAPNDPAPNDPAPNDPAPNDPAPNDPAPADPEPEPVDPTTDPTAAPTSVPTSAPTTVPTVPVPPVVTPPETGGDPGRDDTGDDTTPPTATRLSVTNARIENDALRFVLTSDPTMPERLTVTLTSPAGATFTNGGNCAVDAATSTVATCEPTPTFLAAGSSGMRAAAETIFEVDIPISIPDDVGPEPVRFAITAPDTYDVTYDGELEAGPPASPEDPPAPEITISDVVDETPHWLVPVTITDQPAGVVPDFELWRSSTDSSAPEWADIVEESGADGNYVVKIHMPPGQGQETVVLVAALGEVTEQRTITVGRPRIEPREIEIEIDEPTDTADGTGREFQVAVSNLPAGAEPDFTVSAADGGSVSERVTLDDVAGSEPGSYLVTVDKPAGYGEESVRITVAVGDVTVTSDTFTVGTPVPVITFGDVSGEPQLRELRVYIAHLPAGVQPTFSLVGATHANLQGPEFDSDSGGYVVRVQMTPGSGEETVAVHVDVPLGDVSGTSDEFIVGDDSISPTPGEVVGPGSATVNFTPWITVGALSSIWVVIADVPEGVEPTFELVDEDQATLEEPFRLWGDVYWISVRMPPGQCEETVRLQVTAGESVALSEELVAGKDKNNC